MLKKIFSLILCMELSMVAQMVITSSDFENGQKIPFEFSNEQGANKVPHVSWSGIPNGTKSLVLICDDPDAIEFTPDGQPFVHWIVYNIPATESNLDFLGRREEKNKNGTMQGETSYEKIGYDGPRPPKGHGIHHYHFKLYALDDMLSLRPGASKSDLVSEMQGKILGQAEIVGTYERKY